MAFPEFASITQTFTGTDGTTPPPTENGVAWTNKINGSQGNIQVTSNTGAGVTAATSNGCYTDRVYGPDLEAFITISTRDNSGATNYSVNFLGRLNGQGTSSFNAYSVAATFESSSTGDDFLDIYKATGGTFTKLGASIRTGMTALNGDALGMRIFGQSTVTIECWYKPTGGAWAFQGSRTDSSSPITTAGRFGLWVENTGYRVDNLGIGNMDSPGSWCSEDLMFGEDSRTPMPMWRGPRVESLFQISDAIGR